MYHYIYSLHPSKQYRKQYYVKLDQTRLNKHASQLFIFVFGNFTKWDEHLKKEQAHR